MQGISLIFRKRSSIIEMNLRDNKNYHVLISCYFISLYLNLYLVNKFKKNNYEIFICVKVYIS